MIRCHQLTKSYPLGHGRKKVFSGLDFRIGKGERIGVLGRNGAGKSTLIKLLGGIETPDSGRIERGMTTSWPLGFGGGFQGSLTGTDNIKFIARIYGVEYRSIRDFVQDFSGLSDDLNKPVKTYSTGMRARLAFGLSLVIDFDCYLVDEVLMAGDQDFQHKCHDEFFIKRGDKALILTSHSADIIRSYCSKALVLKGGSGYFYDDINEALGVYTAL